MSVHLSRSGRKVYCTEDGRGNRLCQGRCRKWKRVNQFRGYLNICRLCCWNMNQQAKERLKLERRERCRDLIENPRPRGLITLETRERRKEINLRRRGELCRFSSLPEHLRWDAERHLSRLCHRHRYRLAHEPRLYGLLVAIATNLVKHPDQFTLSAIRQRASWGPRRKWLEQKDRKTAELAEIRASRQTDPLEQRQEKTWERYMDGWRLQGI